jgi:hypothetical protein
MRCVPSFVGVVFGQADNRCLSAIVQFVGIHFPGPECEAVVVGASVCHGEHIVGPLMEQRLSVQPGAAVGTVVLVRRWMCVEPEAATAVRSALDSVLEVERDLCLSVSHCVPVSV